MKQKRKSTDFRLILIGILIIVAVIATSCNTSRNATGCPKAKQGKTHDKNVRFNH